MTFYTDGSCVGNGKANAKGGYGVVGINDEGLLSFVRANRAENTTNNRANVMRCVLMVKNIDKIICFQVGS